MAKQHLHVFFRQEDAHAEAFRGKHVAVIDVLRATSTLTVALAAGATEARCFRTVREVFRARRRLLDRPLLLCGERNRLPVRGFDLGNSPRDFTPRRCAGRTLLMTTTNGTRALSAARRAREIVLACFFNLSAVAAHLAHARGDIVLLCAGTEGELSLDDVACAGAIAELLLDANLSPSPQVDEAVRTWRRARRSLSKFLLNSEGGVPLVTAGLTRDVRDCARRDRFALVPRVVGWGRATRECRITGEPEARSSLIHP